MIDEGEAKQTSVEEAVGWIKAETAAADADGSTAEADAPVSGEITLEGSLTIAEAEAMHLQLSQILNANVDITIEAEALSRVDTAGTQLIYAFVKEAKNRSLSLTWKSQSDALAECAATLGLTEGMGF